jgi:hypothetical protein
MARDPRYRPGRRRKPTVAWLLDWAAGVLLGLIAALLGLGLAALIGEASPELRWMWALAAWPLGAGLGVWLGAGPPLHAKTLAAALGGSVLAAGLTLSPVWLQLELDGLGVALAIAMLVAAPAAARVALGWARPSS